MQSAISAKQKANGEKATIVKVRDHATATQLTNKCGSYGDWMVEWKLAA